MYKHAPIPQTITAWCAKGKHTKKNRVPGQWQGGRVGTTTGQHTWPVDASGAASNGLLVSDTARTPRWLAAVPTRWSRSQLGGGGRGKCSTESESAQAEQELPFHAIMNVCIYLCLCMYIHIYVCINICIYSYTHIHAHTVIFPYIIHIYPKNNEHYRDNLEGPNRDVH